MDNYQIRIARWADECFGPESKTDKKERMHRFVEEALELAQACGCTRHEVEQLTDYVYGRPIGEVEQEAGGVLSTMSLLCTAWDLNLKQVAKENLRELRQRIDQIRAKRATKPEFGPLPGSDS